MEEGSCCVCGRLASACAKAIIDHEAYPDEGEWFCSGECNDAYHEAEGDYEAARGLLASTRRLCEGEEAMTEQTTMDIAAIERACVARGWACTVERIGGSADGPISIRVEVPCYPVASTATLLWRGTHWRIHQVAANLADLLAILGALDQHGVK